MASTAMFLVETGELNAASIRLVGAEGRHAATVRRVQAGEAIALTDGAGRVALARVTSVRRGELVCEVERRYEEPLAAPRMVVVQALPKGESAELAVAALTQVGADVVVPWSAARSVTRWSGDRAAKGLARWRATAREAAKQSRRAWLPEIRALASTGDVTALLARAELPLVLHESASEPLAVMSVPAGGDVVVVVGPEGGITDEELAAFTATGAVSVRMGPTVLRTSTAGTAALAVLLSRTPRWGAVSGP